MNKLPPGYHQLSHERPLLEQAQEFAEQENPCGTTHGWHIRKQGDPALAGCDERVACHEREGHVHLMLDA